MYSSNLKDVIKGDRITKHTSSKIFHTHDIEENGDITIRQIFQRFNLANLFTKLLPIVTFEKLAHIIQCNNLRMSSDVSMRRSKLYSCKYINYMKYILFFFHQDHFSFGFFFLVKVLTRHISCTQLISKEGYYKYQYNRSMPHYTQCSLASVIPSTFLYTATCHFPPYPTSLSYVLKILTLRCHLD